MNSSRDDKNLREIEHIIREETEKAIDMDWKGLDANATWDYIEMLKKKLEDGQLYEPLF